MPVLDPIEAANADERVAQVYEAVRQKYGGVVPDLYKILANDPDYLESLVSQMGRVMEPDKIDARTKEIIALVVSAKNGCDYCINAHVMGLKSQHKMDDEAIAEILGVVGLWEEVTRFAIGARLDWPSQK